MMKEDHVEVEVVGEQMTHKEQYNHMKDNEMGEEHDIETQGEEEQEYSTRKYMNIWIWI